VLKSHSRLSSRTTYSSIIPGFDKIKIVDVPYDDLYQQLGKKCLAELGRTLSAMTNFDELLQSHTNDIAFTMGLVGRQLMRTNNTFTTNRDDLIRFRDKFFAYYQQFTNTYSMVCGSMTFSEYLDYTLAKSEAEPALVISSPEAQAGGVELTKGIPEIISQLPDDAQWPFAKLSNVCIPATFEGMALESGRKLVKKIKALDLPDHQASNTAPAKGHPSSALGAESQLSTLQR
jgi:hypothetical protein